MHSLVNETLKAGNRISSEGHSWKFATCPTLSESSGEDRTRGGNTTDDYTSGDLSSDDDFVTRQTALTQTPTTNQASTSATVGTDTLVPSPGFTASDYRPLALLCPPPPSEDPRTARHVRKRRRLAGSTGKVMKEAVFESI